MIAVIEVYKIKFYKFVKIQKIGCGIKLQNVYNRYIDFIDYTFSEFPSIPNFFFFDSYFSNSIINKLININNLYR